MSIKIRDIARAAGVSTATVSRALNQPHLVQPETRKRILEVIEEAHYVPNPLAKALSTGQTNLVGMVLPTLTNPVFAQMAEGCQQELGLHQLNLVTLMGQRDNQNELDVLRSMDQRQLKGFIISGSAFTMDNYREILDSLQIPAVIMENLPEPAGHPCVYCDDSQGFRNLARRLLEAGHRHLGVISGQPGFLDTRRRLAALDQELGPESADIRVTRETATYGSLESGRRAMERLLKLSSPPTAVICLNDLLALGALRAAWEMNVSVPGQVSVTGYDDIPMAAYSSPALTTIHAPNLELGRQAARMLLKRLETPTESTAPVILPVELMVRQSCL